MNDGETNWRAILDEVEDAVILTGAAGEIAWINAAGMRMFGYGLGELAGRRLGELLPAFHDGLDAAIFASRMETRGRRRCGSDFSALLSSPPGAGGELCLRAFVVRERRDAPIPTAAGASAAELRAGTASLVHELNQPLAAASAYVASAQRLLRLVSSAPPEDAGEALRRAAEQIDRMTGVLLKLRAFVAEREDE